MIIEFLRCQNGEDISYYFKIINNNSKEYEQRILINNGEILSHNCTCIFGSIYRFSKENTEKDTKCRHILEDISLLKFLGYLKDEVKI